MNKRLPHANNQLSKLLHYGITLISRPILNDSAIKTFFFQNRFLLGGCSNWPLFSKQECSIKKNNHANDLLIPNIFFTIYFS